MASIKDLKFTDLYVCTSDTDVASRYNPIQIMGIRPRNMEVSAVYRESINSLVQVVHKEEDEYFSLDWEDMRLRGVRFVDFNDKTWVVLRRFPSEVPDLANLGFRDDVLNAFSGWGKRSGLIVIGGSTGAGKTTTACSMLKYFLLQYGQMAVTIEDPVEYYLQGPYGTDDGYCIQMLAKEEEDWEHKLKIALRMKPRYIFVGEIRTAGAASSMLRAANSGHLVICTVHGGRVEETLSAIVQIASSRSGDMSQSLLADGLLAVVHQRLEGGKPINQILSTQDDPSDPIRNLIRAGKLPQLSSEINKQGTLRRKVSDNNQQEQKQTLPPPVRASTAAPASERPRLVTSEEPPRKKSFFSW